MPKPSERTSIKVQSERIIAAAVRLPSDQYDQRDPFGEITALAEQAGGKVVGIIEQHRQKPESGTYMGSGKLKELKGLCDATDATTVVFDHELSPKQIGNIEQAIERKVLDRSELILDIFASRATTHEAKLQVELAQVQYTYPRLRAMWSHLERIVGAGGMGGVGTRGPGEQQLEIDRRLAQRRRLDLERELAEIHERKRRMVQKRNQDHATVCFVGYTNAGKSTLFNRLTVGGAYADDRVFATLMTRTREWDVGRGHPVMLSDTVGFVRSLPHHLVASFRATLEEATHADLLLIVLDVSDPAAELHFETAMHTLDELERDVADEPGWRRPERLLLLNKADLLDDNRELLVWRQRSRERSDLIRRDPIPISATDESESPMGHAELIDAVRVITRGEERHVRITLPLSDSLNVHKVETLGEVTDREYDNGAVKLHTTIGAFTLERLRSGAPAMQVEGDDPPEKPGW